MNKFTKLEKSWILYDMANSAFILLVATLLPIYFNALAQNAGIGMLAVIFILGLYLFRKSCKMEA